MLEKYHYQIFTTCACCLLLPLSFLSYGSKAKKKDSVVVKDLQIIQKDIYTTVWKEGNNASVTTIHEKDSFSNVNKQSHESSSWTTIKWKKTP